jgi:hypothetical protein
MRYTRLPILIVTIGVAFTARLTDAAEIICVR